MQLGGKHARLFFVERPEEMYGVPYIRHSQLYETRDATIRVDQKALTQNRYDECEGDEYRFTITVLHEGRVDSTVVKGACGC